MGNPTSNQIAASRNFFLARPKHELGAVAAATTTGDPPGGPSSVPAMFQPRGNTTGSVMQFNGTLPEDVSAADRTAFAALLKKQQFYLQSGIGLVSAYLTRKYQQDPAQWANPANWDEPLSNLPPEFYTVSDASRYTFQQRMPGIQLASSFLSKLAAWAHGARMVGAFSGLLNALSTQVRDGVKSASSSMQTYHLSFGYQPIQDHSGAWQLVSMADYYFISFGQNEKAVYSSCASAQLFEFNFYYLKGSVLLNWPVMSAEQNRSNLEDWTAVITGAAPDDCTRAKNFFASDATPPH